MVQVRCYELLVLTLEFVTSSIQLVKQVHVRSNPNSNVLSSLSGYQINVFSPLCHFPLVIASCSPYGLITSPISDLRLNSE